MRYGTCIETPEVVGHRIHWPAVGVEPAKARTVDPVEYADKKPVFHTHVEDVMTIAQHERIVATLKAQIAENEHLPLFTCRGKGGEYAKLGYAKPAGALKTIQGDNGVVVYRDIESGQLYFRDPHDFQSRMTELCILEPCSLGGEILRELTTADRLGDGK